MEPSWFQRCRDWVGMDTPTLTAPASGAGAGALLAGCVESAELVAYPELGPEAIRRLEVRDLPLTVALDSEGGDLYLSGPRAYLESLK